MVAKITTQEEQDKAMAEQEYVFVIYGAQWCGPCKKFKEWLSEQYPDYPHPILLVDVEESEDLAQDISALPTMIGYHQQKEFIRTEGFDRTKLQPIFDQALNKESEEKSE